MGNPFFEPIDYFGPDKPEGPAPKNEVAKMRFYHDALIELILTNPTISQNELARECGYSATWVSIIVNSSSFKERLAERKGELVDPVLRATILEKVDGAASRALDRLIDRLDSPTHGAIKTQDLVSIAKLSVGPKTAAPPPPPNLYVVALPAPAADSRTWLQTAQRHPPGVSDAVEIPRPGLTTSQGT